MTKEEAINILSRPITMKNTPSDILEAHKIAIEALKRESCSDTIGRQTVSEAITKIGLSKNNTNEVHVAVECLRAVEALPSVLPQQRIGYWLRWYERKETEQYRENIPHCNCSECGKEYDPHSSKFIKFCSNCGAEMQEA